jgi:hypothetical protein
MSKVSDVGKFIAQIAPQLIDFGRALYERFDGDADAAKQEIRRIGNHGEAFDSIDAQGRAELEQMRKGGG